MDLCAGVGEIVPAYRRVFTQDRSGYRKMALFGYVHAFSIPDGPLASQSAAARAASVALAEGAPTRACQGEGIEVSLGETSQVPPGRPGWSEWA